MVQPGSGKYRLAIPRIDMTPMVDLGFLLITFFIFTSSMAESKAMHLYMPADGPPTHASETTTLTFLLASENNVVWFEGKWGGDKSALHTTNYGIIGNIIRNKQQRLGNRKAELMMLIKPGPEAAYRNVVDLLDEATINAVKRYAIVEPDAVELKFLNLR